MVKQLRRACGTIHLGHIDPEYYAELPQDAEDKEQFFNEYLDFLIPHLDESNGYRAGAFALEYGEKTGRLHVQFYVEFQSSSPKRLTTLVKEWRLTVPEVFDTVRSAKGSWNYCAGQGDYEDKGGVIRRYVFGEPLLFGTDKRTGLAEMVTMVIDGASLKEIMLSDPYAWSIHRARIYQLYLDWNNMSNLNPQGRQGGPIVGFSSVSADRQEEWERRQKE